MFALSDAQLATVMDAASALPVEKRGVFLERLSARLAQHGSRITDADVDDAIRRALLGLMHPSRAA
jgi:hypothetical protein